MDFARRLLTGFFAALLLTLVATPADAARKLLRGTRAASSFAYTTPTPTALTGWVSGTPPSNALSQTGSRIYYINPNHTTGNPSGVDNPATLANCQSNIMYWNGTNIVDALGYIAPSAGAGTPYGTDPLNPSGTVNEFTLYTSVAPRGNTSTDICGSATALSQSAPSTSTRAGFDDFVLTKRGTTVDITADLAAWNAIKAGGAATIYGISLPSGASSTRMSVFGSYGPTSVAPPIFKRPTASFSSGGVFIIANGAINNALFTGFTIDGGDRTAAPNPSYASMNTIPAGSYDVRFEDVWFKRGAGSFGLGSGGSEETQAESTMAGGVTFVGCLFTDTYRHDSGSNGIFFGGKRTTSRLNITSSIFARNGLERDPTLYTPFVPTGLTSIAGDSVVSITGNGTTVTVTTSRLGNSHGVSTGDSVTISGANEAGFNGTFTATSANNSLTFTYPSSGSGTATGTLSYTTVYRYGANPIASRNVYLSGALDTANSLITDSFFVLGASGFQNRPGAQMTGNFLYEGYATIAATQGVASLTGSTASTGVYNDNVLQRYSPTATSAGAVANSGDGWLIGGGLYNAEFARNMFVQSQWPNRISGTGFGLGIAAYIGDTDEPFHRATTGLNIHDNIIDALFTGSAAAGAFFEDDGNNRPEPWGQYGFPITGTWVIGQTLTVNIGTVGTGTVTGTPAYQWNYNNTPIGGETAATHVILSGELTAPATTGRGLRGYVTGLSFAGTTGLGLRGNVFLNNVAVNQTTTGNSTRAVFGIPTGNTAPTATDTVYTTNRLYSSFAAAVTGEAGAGYTWSDYDRTLKTYLQSLGYTVTSVDGAQEWYDLVTTTCRRGTWVASICSAKKLNNYIRAGRGLGPISFTPAANDDIYNQRAAA